MTETRASLSTIQKHDRHSRAVQILLKDVFTTHVGTAFYTPFFIVSRDSNRADTGSSIWQTVRGPTTW